MALPPLAQVTHIGLYVTDLERMTAFYAGLFGLVQTDSSDNYHGARIVFLSRSADEHHQIVLITGRPEQRGFSPINQISLRVQSLEDLKRYYDDLRTRGVKIQRTITHGNAWSIYFFDPEENRLELYCGSPWYVTQPYGVDMDFSLPADVIRANTQALIRDDPSRQSHETWSAQLGARIARLEDQGQS
jgi:catechol 2,3-dioxygenase-like lactoylglutathione lyase family enzyme